MSVFTSISTNQRHSQQNGFTMIELLIVAIVSGILMTLAATVYSGYIVQTETVELVNAYKATELEVRAPARTSSGLRVCDNSLVAVENLANSYVQLSIQAIPNDPLDPASDQGYGAALRVTATLDQQGTNGLAIASAFYKEASGSRRQGVISDSVVTFDVLLSVPGRPYCEHLTKVATTSATPALTAGTTAATAGLTGTTPGAINRAPVASNNIVLGSTAEDTAIKIDSNKLLSASYDPDGDTLTITRVTAASGSITGNAASGYTYTPAADFNGQGVKISFEVSDGTLTGHGQAALDVTPVVDPPTLSLSMTAAQQVLRTGGSGRAVIPRVDTGGDMSALSLEFSVLGHTAGDANAGSGPVIFNYGNSASNNIISAWRPNNLNIAFLSKGYDAHVDLTDGANHRVTISWSSSTGDLKIFDNGVLTATHHNVATGQQLPGNGYAVVGQKMNRPASQDGWNTGEHYGGQIFGTTMVTEARTDSQIAQQPLYTTSRSDGLVLDLRTQGTSMTDSAANPVQMQGDFGVDLVAVDTDMALVPPGSRVTLSVQVNPLDSDSTVQSVKLQGLPSAVQISDSSGHSGSGNVDITQWDLGAIALSLPPSLKTNLSIILIASVAGPDGNTASTTITKILNLAP
ncbi:MAG: prepilin-type N-terminal cleavage/methylation domain-containing protein [Candidatus Azotimanducaceae bacterium]|jgi:prepilin-type N-terminal cleavage/methylation domain-containing protein